MSRGNSQDLFDNILATALDILRLSAGERNKVFARLAKMQRALVARMSNEDLAGLGKRELAAMLRDTNALIGAAYNQITGLVDLPAIALHIAEDTAHALQIYFGLDALAIPRQDYFKSILSDVMIQGAPSADWWRGQAVDTQNKFAQQIRMGLVSGETNQQIVARIVGKSGQAGVMDTVRRNVQSLVHTSVQTVASDARRETYQSNDDLVKGIRQVSTLDSHTSVICMAYSGCEWDMEYNPIGPFNKRLPYKGGVPRHWVCRSVEVPITATFAELGLDIPEPPVGTRASDEGPIKADTTFDSFLKRKSASYLDEKLGAGRADLFRSGKITLRDLVNGDGNPVSLEALRELAAKRRGR